MNRPLTERVSSLLQLRYRVVLGCGHQTAPFSESSSPPTTAAVAKCDACGRHVPVFLEVIDRG